MKESTKMFLKIFIISLIIFLPFEYFYYYIQDNYGMEKSYYFSIISQNLTFSFFGCIGFFVSLNLYRILKTKEEISMVTFLLKSSEMTEECKVLFYISVICVICWSVYTLCLPITLGIIPPLVSKRISEMIGDGFLFSSILFSLAAIFMFNRWLKRVKKYV
ncbi:MAG: hypothetical protein QXD54_02625 [Candidatus Aenigmatarchaeota archaeon]